MIESEAALWGSVLAAPEDWDRRLILADWYEEQGLALEAEACRWMAHEQKRPLGETWFDAEFYLSDPSSNLPHEIFRCLKRQQQDTYEFAAFYASDKTSEEECIRAWVEAYKKGWRPDAGGR